MNNEQSGRPLKIFTNFNAIAVIIGIVVGIGIFRLPSMVAQNSATELHFIGFWIAGGIISIIGALCYAELATNNPDAGGEYHFLTQSFGSGVGFLFSWGRMTVIQTGSIALAAFILGDYASVIYDLGSNSSAIYAGISVIGLTALNIIGTGPSKNAQSIMTTLIVALLLIAGFAGLLVNTGPPEAGSGSGGVTTSAGAAMIFVLLTYGGWNEGVYLSAEIKQVRKNMSRVLLGGAVYNHIFICADQRCIPSCFGTRNASRLRYDRSCPQQPHHRNGRILFYGGNCNSGRPFNR